MRGFSMKQRWWLRLIAFISIVLLIAVYLGPVLAVKQTVLINGEGTTLTIAGQYAEPRDSLDVLSLGSSISCAMVFPKTIYDAQGIAVYSLATPQQNARLGYYLLLDALRRQNPSLLLLNPGFLFDGLSENEKEGLIQIASVAMRPSFVKLRMQLDMSKQLRGSNLAEFFFPILRFHERITELERSDFDLSPFFATHPFKGTLMHFARYTGELNGTYLPDAGAEVAFARDGLAYTEKILAVCGERGIRVLVVAPPKTGSWTRQHHALAESYCAENGLNFLDFNDPETLAASDFDPRTDYMDAGVHANFYGQQKLSAYLAAYLREHYPDLPDHRGDARYASWDRLAMPEPPAEP